MVYCKHPARHPSLAVTCMAGALLVLVVAWYPPLCWAAEGDPDDVKGKAGAEGEAIDVTILRDGQSVTQQNNLVWVGERINLSVSVPNGYTVSLYNWRIPTVYVKDWPAARDQASVAPLPAADKAKSSLDFCWVDGGTVSQPAVKTVECYVHIEGQGGVHRKAEFRVRRPTVTTFSATLGPGAKAHLSPAAGPPDFPHTMMRFCDATPSEGAGVEYAVTIAKVDGAWVGQWQLVHVMKPRRHVKDIGLWRPSPQNDRTDIGDGYWFYRRGDGKEWSGIPDAPMIGLSGERWEFGGVRCGNVVGGGLDPEQFWVYLMWKPPVSTSIWVPLEYLSWKWAGEAAKIGGAWTMIAQPTPVMAFNRTVTTDFPQWNEDFKTEW